MLDSGYHVFLLEKISVTEFITSTMGWQLAQTS